MIDSLSFLSRSLNVGRIPSSSFRPNKWNLEQALCHHPVFLCALTIVLAPKCFVRLQIRVVRKTWTPHRHSEEFLSWLPVNAEPYRFPIAQHRVFSSLEIPCRADRQLPLHGMLRAPTV